MAVTYRRTEHPSGQRRQAGFGITGLAIIVVVMGLLIVPLMRLTASSVGATRVQQTQAAFHAARDALVAFAAQNNGCLPFAADFEGGLPDTDSTGGTPAGYFDDGGRTQDNHAGDLPWDFLGLTNAFLGRDALRIQYFVATPYTDQNASVDSIRCKGGFRGFEWQPGVTYDGTTTPIYVYYGVAPDRRLYKIIGVLPADTTPDSVDISIVEVSTALLPTSLLEVRRGPDVINGGPSETVTESLQNVFVLIAPGDNRNADLDRRYVRDSNHVADSTGTAWTIQNVTISVDDAVFSLTHNVDATDSGNDGDDTLSVMSFLEYQAELSKYGLHMEPICHGAC